jgi:hypothetical protein
MAERDCDLEYCYRKVAEITASQNRTSFYTIAMCYFITKYERECIYVIQTQLIANLTSTLPLYIMLRKPKYRPTRVGILGILTR